MNKAKLYLVVIQRLIVVIYRAIDLGIAYIKNYFGGKIK